MVDMSDFDDLIQQIQTCTRCTLSEKRTRAVPGEGDHNADIMFIGEGPGYYEDQQGRPFVGQAGALLNELLATIGLKREDVYITNMVKCRPPNNRDPIPGELQACRPYLDEQLEMISPKVLVTLGRHSFTKFFPGESISKARGKPRKWKNFTVYPITILRLPYITPGCALCWRAISKTFPLSSRALTERLWKKRKKPANPNNSAYSRFKQSSTYRRRSTKARCDDSPKYRFCAPAL